MGVAGCSLSSRPDIRAHGLCTVLGDRVHYDGRSVSFRARLESDGIERAVLVDPACPKQGIVPDKFSVGEGDLVDEALASGLPGTVDKVVEATWTGVVHVEGRMVTLDVTDISQVQWHRLPEASPRR